jgi:hypothetical protein
MRCIRRILLVAGVSLALSAFAPSVSASSSKPFHLDKTCASGILCTVVSSGFNAIPAGTDITYTYDDSDPWDGLAYPTIDVRNGSSTGVCDWFQPAGPVLAKCTFDGGSGRLSQFHLAVDVTVTGDPADPASIWHWDGAYSYGSGS